MICIGRESVLGVLECRTKLSRTIGWVLTSSPLKLEVGLRILSSSELIFAHAFSSHRIHSHSVNLLRDVGACILRSSVNLWLNGIGRYAQAVRGLSTNTV